MMDALASEIEWVEPTNLTKVCVMITLVGPEGVPPGFMGLHSHGMPWGSWGCTRMSCVCYHTCYAWDMHDACYITHMMCVIYIQCT